MSGFPTLADQAYDDLAKELEDTYRVLFHVVSTYDLWRTEGFLPNELSDDAVRVGRDHLKQCAWWPDPTRYVASSTGEADRGY